MDVSAALLFFKDADAAHEAVSFGGGYLAAPNVGVLGSSAARAIPLAATLLAWGREGLAARIGHCLRLAEQAAAEIAARPELELFAEPSCGVVAWRPRSGGIDDAVAAAPAGTVSTTRARGEHWLRFVAANPNADMASIAEYVRRTAAL